MKSADFQAILGRLGSLTRNQIKQAQKALSAEAAGRDAHAAFADCQPTHCKLCADARIVRNGIQRGQQRWLCRACGKSFCATTATPLNRLHGKALFGVHAQAMADGLTLRDVRDKLNISLSRALKWRHRFLELPQSHQAGPIQGILEVDEIYFKINRKGQRKMAAPRKRGGLMSGQGRLAENFVPVLVGRARGGEQVVDKALPNMSKTSIASALAGSVSKDGTVLCMDSHKSFLEIGKMLGVEANIFVEGKRGVGRRKPEGFHVQNVNNYHQRLRDWIDIRLRGVASKNLDLYLAWMRMKWWWRKEPMPARDVLASALGCQIVNSN